MRSITSQCRERGSAVVEFALVAPFVMGLLIALLQLAFTMHVKSVLESATEDAARVAAAFGGNTSLGEQRFRSLVGEDRGLHTLTWTRTLDTLTLRVRSTLPLAGELGPAALVTTASAYQEV